jgi:hypothetical protein
MLPLVLRMFQMGDAGPEPGDAGSSPGKCFKQSAVARVNYPLQSGNYGHCQSKQLLKYGRRTHENRTSSIQWLYLAANGCKTYLNLN